MSTDIERLHAVVSGKSCGRNSGKTYARVHELASNIELGISKKGVIVISEYWDLNYLLPMISEVFKERGLPPIEKKRPYMFQCGEVLFSFVSSRDYPDFMRGGRDAFEVPMGHWD